MHLSTTWRSALFALAVGTLTACGSRQVQNEPENQREIDIQPTPPAYPTADKLKRLDLGPDQDFQYSVDVDSISIGPGPVVLYTLVVRSPAGATNVSYEAMRCRPLERKIFALGRSDGTWSASKRPEWLPITRSMTGYVTLADFYFCPGRRSILTQEEAV